MIVECWLTYSLPLAHRPADSCLCLCTKSSTLHCAQFASAHPRLTCIIDPDVCFIADMDPISDLRLELKDCNHDHTGKSLSTSECIGHRSSRILLCTRKRTKERKGEGLKLTYIELLAVDVCRLALHVDFVQAMYTSRLLEPSSACNQISIA